MRARFASILVLGSLCATSALALEPRFHDVPADAWYAPYVEKAADAGIVNGYTDADGVPTGEFGPTDRVTLEQALKMILEAGGYEETVYSHACGTGCAAQFTASPWAYPYVTVAIAERFDAVKGEKANLRRYATRAEVAQMVTDAFRPSTKADTIVPETFSDVSLTEVAHHASAVNDLLQDGVMTGDQTCDPTAQCPMTTFRPTDTIIRAEVAKVVMLGIEKYGERGEGMQPTKNAYQRTAGEVEMWYFPSQGFFYPNGELSIRPGTVVRFVNRGKPPIWVASDPHPTHDALTGFDAKGPMQQNDSYYRMFAEEGTWSFHNHMNPGNPKAHGEVVVE
jgi:plastocyanin